MRLRSKLVAIPLSAALAGAGLMTVSAPPAVASSLPICTKGTWISEPVFTIYMPTTSSNSTSCFLARGDVSSAVTALQKSLKICFGKNIAIDGDFGPATESALKSVQSGLGITADGVYGTQSRNSMLFVIAEPNPIGPCRFWPGS
ncbi:peptidoglycan-binding domain-containing protein [Streptomyces sp. CA-106131]|uniref:peptidoglycan-binding domain-containing protein n=1 Tax=Streptomyces sp. CA-106131 TaxID=3240045 RepID=UPI003D943840